MSRAAASVETNRLVELNAAYHEIGHGIAARRGGLRVHHCKLIRSSDGVAATGVTGIDLPEDGADGALWDAFAVFLHAGIAAQTRHADEIGHLDRGVARRIEQAAAGDLEWWAHVAPRTTLTPRRARQAADRLVASRWSRFASLAERLVADLYLPGRLL